jgi:hypothetical protein
MSAARHTFLTSLELQWTLANALGWSTVAIVGDVGLEGFAVGFLQWCVIRPRTRVGPSWVALTGAAWWIGLALMSRADSLFIPDAWYVVATGLVVGAFQWILLGARRDRALLWLPINGISAWLSWELGGQVGFDLYQRWNLELAYMPAAGLVGGAVAGAITAIPLRWLLGQHLLHRQPPVHRRSVGRGVPQAG